MTTFQRVFSNAPWEKRVGYCRAVRAGAHVHVTGTVAIDEAGQTYAAGDAYAQAARCLELIERALQQLGAARGNIVRTRMYTTDIDRWPEIGRAHSEFFLQEVPATTLVQVSRLIGPDMLIEIEADAYVTSEP